MYFEASLYMGRTPLDLPTTGRTFSLSFFGYTIAVNVRTTPPKVQQVQPPKISRTLSSCPCAPAASGCIYPCNQEACTADTDILQKEKRLVEVDQPDTCNSNHTTPVPNTESTTELQESKASS